MYRSLFVFLVLFPVVCAAQVSSVQNGLYSDPATWSCNCVPQGPADITINDSVTLDMDIFLNGGCLFGIAAAGSLIENAPYQVTLEAAIMQNSGMLRVSAVVSEGQFCDFWNYTTAEISSWIVMQSNGMLFNEGQITTHELVTNGTVLHGGNAGATIQADLVENHGTFQNAGILIADSVFTDDLFVNSETCQTRAFVNLDRYNSLTGTLNASGNVYIGGSSYQWEDSRLNVDGNLTLAGRIHYVGQAVVSGDLYIDAVTELDGTGGICVGGTSSNAGAVSEIYFCDATGNDFDLNTGTIAPDVVYCTNSVCALGIEEQFLQVSISPNPASVSFSVAAAVPVESVQLYALTGALVRSVRFSEMAIDGIVPGMYFVGINGTTSGLRHLIVH